MPDLALTVSAAVTALGPEWLDPQTLLTELGDIAFWVVLGIIFAECGLLIGFFLPGDSLLFITGLFIASGFISINIWLACLLLLCCAPPQTRKAEMPRAGWACPRWRTLPPRRPGCKRRQRGSWPI